ncbi:uncharacterized protein LOC128232702 [Mya arenaria]|uniref:uncharacterized protein LOC128232702 n=1 Tax=Mya arenaria TaxID=6604 RepID=UPI0022E3F937|nr:uncharacterized protein LOC128232702 [Mya arenaria]
MDHILTHVAFVVLLLVSMTNTQEIPTKSKQASTFDFMPGSSPVKPNLVLAMCQQQATKKTLDIPRQGKSADDINAWCSEYDGVLPCLSRTLPSAIGPNDTFLQLIFNETQAFRISRSLCKRFAFRSNDVGLPDLPSMSNLTCVEARRPAVARCLEDSSQFAVEKYYKLFSGPRNTLPPDNRKMASIYACIISVATAGCYHRELNGHCAVAQWRLLFDYHIMLAGKCRDIAGVPETTTLPLMKTTPTLEVTNRMDVQADTPGIQLPESTPTSDQTSLQTTGKMSNVTPKTSDGDSGSGSSEVWRRKDGGPGNSVLGHSPSLFILPVMLTLCTVVL